MTSRRCEVSGTVSHWLSVPLAFLATTLSRRQRIRERVQRVRRVSQVSVCSAVDVVLSLHSRAAWQSAHHLISSHPTRTVPIRRTGFPVPIRPVPCGQACQGQASKKKEKYIYDWRGSGREGSVAKWVRKIVKKKKAFNFVGWRTAQMQRFRESRTPVLGTSPFCSFFSFFLSFCLSFFLISFSFFWGEGVREVSKEGRSWGGRPRTVLTGIGFTRIGPIRPG